MQKYLMVCGHELADKNKLDAALKEWFKKEDRRVFESEDEIKRFVAETKAVCELEHPRCKEIEVYVKNRATNKMDLIVRGGMSLHVDFFAFENWTQTERNIAAENAGGLILTENFMIHRVEEYDAEEDENGVPYLTVIYVQYRFFGKIGEAKYDARSLNLGLGESILEIESDSDIHDSLNAQIEEHKDGILVFLKAWVKAYNEGLAEDEKG